jgi:hypothetical protein
VDVLIAVSFTLIGFFCIGFVTLKLKPNPLYCLHAVLFWGFVVGFNSLSAWANDTRNDQSIYILVHLLLLAYLTIYLWFASILSSPSETDSLFSSIRSLTPTTLALSMIPWLVFRIYLLIKYGAASFQLLALRQEVDASYLEASLNTLLLYPALGAFFAYIIKAVFDPRTLLNPLITALSSFIFLFVCLFSELLSSRRFMFSILVLIGLILVYRQEASLKMLRPRIFMMGGLLGLITLALAEFYQQIRYNLFEPEFLSLINEGDILSIARAVFVYFTLEASVQHTVVPVESFATVENLMERFSPFQVMYAISERQIDDFTTTNGRILLQSFYNVIPSAFLPLKETKNADEFIAEAYDLEDTDLPTGILSSFQSDISWAAFVLTPLLMVVLISGYKKLLLSSQDSLSKLVLLGLCILTATYVEALFDAVLVNLRDLMLLLAFGMMLRHARKLFSSPRPTLN